jgi:hypothetical protein
MNRLNLKIVFMSLLLVAVVPAMGQGVQTIRGRVVDEVAGTPLVGVNVIVKSQGPAMLGASTDMDGNFEIINVPLGKHALQVSYLGYEEQLVSNVLVTAGKEVVLTLRLTESVKQLAELVVQSKSTDDKTATNNDLAVVSSRSFNVDDTKRYAGALGDPSRMAANYAGVISGNDSRNDIVVRGNSPSGMLWQLEGLNIPNPNHFGSLNSTGGPVSMLNNNNLDKSDFMTSAFPAQYGNATAGVFDLRLRDGNNSKSEYLAQVGFSGFELGAEGPLSKKSKASYIINYRYSTLGLFQTLGIDFGTGSNTPIYQDLNFKISLRSKNSGKWTIFGLGGNSKIDLLGSDIDKVELESDDSDLYGDENTDTRPRYQTGIVGVSYEMNVSPKTYMKVTAGLSRTQEKFTSDSLVRNDVNDVTAYYLRAEGELTQVKPSLVFHTRTKFNPRNSLTSGIYIDANRFDLYNRDVYANLGLDSVRVNVEDTYQLYQAYSTWRHRFNNKFSINTGLHAQYYSLTDQAVLEPRIGASYVINGRHTLSAGFGVHNQAQNIYTSYVQTRQDDDYILTNKDLGFTTNTQYVVTYDWFITENLRLKAEAYYQTLTNVPVEAQPSSYSAINSGLGFAPDDRDYLVNEGTGTNKGVELTIERFFTDDYYFLVTGSLFDSKYKGSDDIERNTAYNTQYVLNALAGKEFRVGRKKNYLVFNLKMTTVGGRYLTPIDLDASGSFGRPIYVESEAFSEKQDPYFRTDIRVSYRKEYRKSTLEVALDLQNVTNNKNIFAQTYNPRTNSIATEYQQGFFPVPFIRYTF